MICIWLILCHCHPSSLGGLPFWCQLTLVFLEKRLLNLSNSSSNNSLGLERLAKCDGLVCNLFRATDYLADEVLSMIH